MIAPSRSRIAHIHTPGRAAIGQTGVCVGMSYSSKNLTQLYSDDNEPVGGIVFLLSNWVPNVRSAHWFALLASATQFLDVRQE